jgi:hypothetical protein
MAKRKTAGESNANKPLPKCKAILLCDRIIEEAGTGQVSLIGILEARWPI